MKVDWSDVRWTPSPGFRGRRTATQQALESYFHPPMVVTVGDPAEFEAEVDFPDEDLARRFAKEGGECIVEGDECIGGPYRLRFSPGHAIGKTVSCSMRATPEMPTTPA